MKIWPLKWRGLGHVTIFEILGPPLYRWNDQRHIWCTHWTWHVLANAQQIGPYSGRGQVTWPKFIIWDPLLNFRMDKATHSKFRGLIHCLKPFDKIWIFDIKGAWLRSRDHYRNFGTPFISLEWPKIETSYLVHILTMTCTSQCITNWNLKWAWSGSRDLNLKFGTPSITFERIQLCTPNFVG